jgi:hypothetical protein
MSTIRVTVLFAAAAALGVGCEPEIGSPCDDEAEVLKFIQPKAGTSPLVLRPAFQNCSQGLCLSIDGSRPFCTKRCEDDLECAEAGDGFTCSTDDVIFGPNACRDFEDPTQPRPGAEAASGAPCAAEGDPCAVEGESCFTAGPSADTCGFPGRDCLTGPDGGQSEAAFGYCAASPDVIAARDAQFGRAP